jgi:hypothetical protein
MKKLFSLTLLVCGFVFASKAQPAPAVDLSTKIANKMKDSLNLSQQQQQQIFAVNMSLFNQKAQARTQYHVRDSVDKALQKIENNRDSLYRPILTQQQFGLYQQKKRTLISNN